MLRKLASLQFARGLTEVNTPTDIQSVGVFLRTSTPIESDFTVHGPYLTASWRC